MSRTYLTLGDIAGKLTILASNARGANGRAATTLPKLLAQHGHRGNMSKVGLRPEMRLSLSNSIEPKRLELLRKLAVTRPAEVGLIVRALAECLQTAPAVLTEQPTANP
jgi:hypothetical protein